MAIQVRATQQSISARVMAGLQTNLTRMGRLQEQLSSGKVITRPSDSPTGTVSSMQLRAQIRTAEQYSRNAEDGIGWLSTLDGALTSMLGQVRQARDITLQGMSSGVGGSVEARGALAVEVTHIRESLVAIANTRYLDRPVFGGITSGNVAYDSTGTFRPGPVGQVLRTVGDDTTVRVDLDGPTAFGVDGDAHQLFTVLEKLSTDLAAGNVTGLQADLDNLDTAMNRLQTVLAGVGARYNRVEQMRHTADDRALDLRAQLSDVEDIDLPKTIMEMKLQETAYQAALAATSRVIQPSLMDYLR